MNQNLYLRQFLHVRDYLNLNAVFWPVTGIDEWVMQLWLCSLCKTHMEWCYLSIVSLTTLYPRMNGWQM